MSSIESKDLVYDAQICSASSGKLISHNTLNLKEKVKGVQDSSLKLTQIV